ncbi:MAG: DUF4296 domain-containing protein [Maribacter sp.]
MKKSLLFLLLILIFSCAEKLLDEPDNLIPKEKMILILNDLAIANAAKVTNSEILRNHEIEPTNYIFVKYAIDSIQFVESDRYYASIPEEHEEIYMAVEAKLETEKDRIANAKKVRDSLKALDMKATKKGLMPKDSLPKNDGKKK